MRGLVYWLKWMVFRHPIAATPRQENQMADGTVVQGGSFPFHVEARNKAGNLVPITDATVALSDPSLGSVSVNADGSGGVFIAGAAAVGSEAMTPTAGGVTGAAFVLDVTLDNVIASVAIVSDAAASVAIVAG